MKEVLKENEEKSKANKTKNKKKKRNLLHQVYFCVGFTQTWTGKNAIHIAIKKIRKKYELKWLRTSMSYHKFPT